jgi:hypothetical protein
MLAPLVEFSKCIEGTWSIVISRAFTWTLPVPVMLVTTAAEIGLWIFTALMCKHEAESQNVAVRKMDASDTRMTFIVGKLMCEKSLHPASFRMWLRIVK